MSSPTTTHADANDSVGPINNNAKVVTISYKDLTSSNDFETNDLLLSKIGQAFGDGPACLGILAVTDVPNFGSLRSRLLPLARQVATLPPDQLSQIECPEAGYQVGWSHGKEKVEGDKLDTGKGSFYFNPLSNDLAQAILIRRKMMRIMHTSSNVDLAPGVQGMGMGGASSSSSSNEPVEDEEFRKVVDNNPAFFAPNVWPEEALPELEEVAKEMGTLICGVGRLVARLCDKYVESKCEGYSKGKLESVLTQSLCCKARLLHYFPSNEISESKPTNEGENHPSITSDTDFSNWCGWHNDHGSLTGLVPAMYLNSDGEEVPSPDKSAGLYIKGRSGDLVHVQLPPTALAFQIGETSQIHTGGILQATPHAVRGCQGKSSEGISRETFACFMEPEYHGVMDIPEGRTVEDTQKKEAEEHLPRTVKVLRSRWKDGMNFGEFSDATFAAFH